MEADKAAATSTNPFGDDGSDEAAPGDGSAVAVAVAAAGAEVAAPPAGPSSNPFDDDEGHAAASASAAVPADVPGRAKRMPFEDVLQHIILMVSYERVFIL